jgi:hypothetical protein
MTDISEEQLQDFRARLRVAKDLLSQLENKIVNAEVRDQFLSSTKKLLIDVEGILRDPEQNQHEASEGFMLTLAEQHLVRVKKLVTKYGPKIQFVAGK